MIKTFTQYLNESKYQNITLYHGTNKAFDKFNFNMAGRTDFGFLGKGFYLTANKFLANAYADDAASSHGGESEVLEFNINAKKTLELDGTGLMGWNKAMKGLGIAAGSVQDQVKAVRQMGYDSIAAIFNGKIKEFVVFDDSTYRRKK